MQILKILKSLVLKHFLELKKTNGLVVSVATLFVLIQVIVIVAEKRNSKVLEHARKKISNIRGCKMEDWLGSR